MVVAIQKRIVLYTWKHSAAWSAWCPTIDFDIVEGFTFVRVSIFIKALHWPHRISNKLFVSSVCLLRITQEVTSFNSYSCRSKGSNWCYNRLAYFTTIQLPYNAMYSCKFICILICLSNLLWWIQSCLLLQKHLWLIRFFYGFYYIQVFFLIFQPKTYRL